MYSYSPHAGILCLEHQRAFDKNDQFHYYIIQSLPADNIICFYSMVYTTSTIQIRMYDNSSPANPISTSCQSYMMNTNDRLTHTSWYNTILLLYHSDLIIKYCLMLSTCSVWIQQPTSQTDNHATVLILQGYGFRYSGHLTCIGTLLWCSRQRIICFSPIAVIFSYVIFGEAVTVLITGNKGAWAGYFNRL